MDRSGARDARADARTRGGTDLAEPGLRSAAALTAALAAIVLLAFGAASASAVIKRLPNGHRISFAPVHGPLLQAPLTSSAVRTAKSGALLEYHGGPVMTSNTNYTFYWAPSGAAAYPRGYQAGVNQLPRRPRRRQRRQPERRLRRRRSTRTAPVNRPPTTRISRARSSTPTRTRKTAATPRRSA